MRNGATRLSLLHLSSRTIEQCPSSFSFSSKHNALSINWNCLLVLILFHKSLALSPFGYCCRATESLAREFSHLAELLGPSTAESIAGQRNNLFTFVEIISHWGWEQLRSPCLIRLSSEPPFAFHRYWIFAMKNSGFPSIGISDNYRTRAFCSSINPFSSKFQIGYYLRVCRSMISGVPPPCTCPSMPHYCICMRQQDVTRAFRRHRLRRITMCTRHLGPNGFRKHQLQHELKSWPRCPSRWC